MQLMNEQQRFPYGYAWAMAVCVVGMASLTTHFIDPSQARANETYWYLERAAGFTSYGMLSLTVLLGVSSSVSFWDKWNMRKVMTQTHQYASLLVFPFLFFHLWGLYMDKSVPFGVTQLLIPFSSSYRTIPIGLGILTLYTWLLLIVSSYFREKIGAKAWRTIHILSFPMFISVTFHGLLSGTDSARPWAMLIYVVPFALFLSFLFMRFRKSSSATKR